MQYHPTHLATSRLHKTSTISTTETLKKDRSTLKSLREGSLLIQNLNAPAAHPLSQLTEKTKRKSVPSNALLTGLKVILKKLTPVTSKVKPALFRHLTSLISGGLNV